MACAPVLTAEVRGAWPAIAPRVAIGSDTAGRLICLLALSLALHLALLGWPTRWHAVAGPRAFQSKRAKLRSMKGCDSQPLLRVVTVTPKG